MLSNLLNELAGISGRTVTTVLAALVLLIGTGHFLCHILKFKFRQTAVRLSVSLSLGFAIAAFCFFLGSFDRRLLGLAGLFLKLCGICGFWIFFQESDFFRPFFRKTSWKPFPIFPVLLALIFAFYSLSAFLYPASWDECVYQLTVPMRWVANGGYPQIYDDLPYSGFPLLPQFVWMYLMSADGGFAAIKIIQFAITVCFFTQIYLLLDTKRTRSIAGIFTISVLGAPIVFHMFLSGYAEPVQGCFVAAALLILRNRKKSWQAMLLAGLLAGAAAAVKLTGGFLALALLLYSIHFSKLKWQSDRKLFLIFCGTAALVAMPFYLRPWILTGNPCYPYFGDIFGAPEHAVTYFHHALGTHKFAPRAITTFLLLLPGLALPSFSAMFDGSYGFQFLLWIILILFYICIHFRKSAKVIAPFGIFAILVLAWVLTSPQARFLLPAIPFLALAVFKASPYLISGKASRRTIFLACCLISMYYAFPRGQIHSWQTNFQTMQKGADGKRDILYGRTGDSMLQLAEILRKPPLSEKKGKCLLILEERTLYLPLGKCEIGTPFFQGKYFKDGEVPDIATFRKELQQNDISMIYLRTPEKNPDYLPSFSYLWYDDMTTLLSDLVKSNDWEAYALPGPAWIYAHKD